MNDRFLSTINELKDICNYELVKYKGKDAIIAYISYEDPDNPRSHLDYPLLFATDGYYSMADERVFEAISYLSVVDHTVLLNHIIGLFVTEKIVKVIDFSWDDIEPR